MLEPLSEMLTYGPLCAYNSVSIVGNEWAMQVHYRRSAEVVNVVYLTTGMPSRVRLASCVLSIDYSVHNAY